MISHVLRRSFDPPSTSHCRHLPPDAGPPREPRAGDGQRGRFDSSSTPNLRVGGHIRPSRFRRLEPSRYEERLRRRECTSLAHASRSAQPHHSSPLYRQRATAERAHSAAEVSLRHALPPSDARICVSQ